MRQRWLPWGRAFHSGRLRRAPRGWTEASDRGAVVGVLLAVGILAGCEKTGFPDLGERVDQTLTCEGPTSTWIRVTEAEGDVTYVDDSTLFEPGDLLHEVVLLAAADPTAPPSEGCFDVFQVGPPGEVPTGSLFLRQGRFFTDPGSSPGEPELRVTEQIEFLFDPAPQLTVLQRIGSARRFVEPARERMLSLRVEGEELVISEGGVEARYRNLNRLAGQLLLDPGLDLAERSRLVGNFFNLAMLCTQSRMLGFGGAGMTQYMDGTGSEFASLTAGTFHVVVGGQLILNNIVTTIDFRGTAEYTGMVLDGPQITETNTGGNGGMRNAIDFSFQLHPTDATQVYEGQVDFGGIEVVDGYGQGGTAATVHPDGTHVDVPFSAVTVVDFSAYL